MSSFEESDPTDVIQPLAPSEGGGGGEQGGESPSGGGGATGGFEPNFTVTVDGEEYTGCALRGSVTRRLNRPAQASVTFPMDCVCPEPGQRLAIYIGYGTFQELFFHGMIMDTELDSGEDFGYVVANASDPMELWQWRPVRDDTCDFSLPTIIEDYVTGPQIMEAALINTVDCGGGPPSDAEGDIFLDLGSFEGGGVDLTGAPTDWPMTIAQLATLLTSTGEVDLVITPTDPGGGVMGTIDGYNGDYGTDLSASITFDYGRGNYNVKRVRWNRDMTQMANKIWYYLGPRVGTADDPAGDQHWRANVTGDDPGLAYPPGGELSPPGSATNNQLGVLRVDSQADFGVRMDIRIYDARGDEAAVGRDLYRRLWQIESWLRAQPRDLIHITPVAGVGIGDFDIGDLVGVSATPDVCGGFSGAQRVYQYTVSWDEDGPMQLSELQTSASQEGF